jgi:hypothetical protein
MNEDDERVEITARWARSLLLNMIKTEFQKWKIEELPYDKENSIRSFIFSIKEDNYANIE